METKILKVMAQTEPVHVPSKKQENGQLAKCYIRLRELGGDYENEYYCVILGDQALHMFDVGCCVCAALRFQTHEYQGQVYQEIIVADIVELPQQSLYT